MSLVHQRCSGSCLAVMLANLRQKDSPKVDYWALHLQMETQMGSKMVDQILKEIHLAVMLANSRQKDSLMVDYWERCL